MDNMNTCPSIYQDIFSNPFVVELIILMIYSLILIVGLIGNIMTIIIIKYNTHLRTPTNFYLLNLAASDLMMLMCNLPLEMLEIYNREWPLSIIFCKMRNIFAEFFTCSSILTILAFTCERYFTIVHPVYLHQLSHFRRAQNIIIIIWLIALGFSLPLGLLYEIESHPTTLLFINNNTVLTRINYIDKSLSISCKSCIPKRSVEKLLSIVFIITSICFFYLPMVIIGAIYLYIGQALRRINKYEGYSNPIECSSSSQSNFSNNEGPEISPQNSHINSYSWLKMRARCHARKVVFKTLVAVVSAFFICYAPLYLQRLLLALTTLNSNFHFELSLLSNFMAYLYIISGVTFYFGSVINPILYNVLSNKYRRAFQNLVCCRLILRRNFNRTNTQKLLPINRLQKQQANHFIRQEQNVEKNKNISIIFCQHTHSNNTKQQITLNIIKKSILPNTYSSHSSSSVSSSRQKKKRSNLYQ